MGVRRRQHHLPRQHAGGRGDPLLRLRRVREVEADEVRGDQQGLVVSSPEIDRPGAQGLVHPLGAPVAVPVPGHPHRPGRGYVGLGRTCPDRH